jgi:hypothetical protein
MIFGRCFENAVGAYFRRIDPTATFFKEWKQQRDASLTYTKNDSWDRLYHQGVHLLERFAQDDRVQIRKPGQNLQVKLTRSLPSGNDFVSYVDAIGEVDGTKCIIDWKTTTSRYPEQPDGLLALDPQLVCYSWMDGLSEVALVVFVRKNVPEVQYLKTTIDEDRGWTIPSAQRDSISSERVCEMPPPGDVLGGSAARGFKAYPPTRSERS